MFTHIMVGSNNLEAARKFYDATMGVLGHGEGANDPSGRLVYSTPTGKFFVTVPIDGKPACHANGGTIGLVCQSAQMVDDWHAAGMANGGIMCEGLPATATRDGYTYHAAWLRDPDGNKLCVAAPA